MKEGVVARKFLRAFAEWDLDTYESLLAPGAVEGRPQMGEKFVGRERIMGMYRSRTGEPPRIEWRRCRVKARSGSARASSRMPPVPTGPTTSWPSSSSMPAASIAVDYYFSTALEPPDYHQRFATIVGH